MLANNEILLELQELSPTLAGISNKNIFLVPQGYFETLSDKIVEFSVGELNINAKAPTFKIPEGYFDNLSTLILNKITTDDAEEELKFHSSFLNDIKHAQTYKTPINYFNELPINLLKRVKGSTVKVIKISRFGQILKYAAAAVIIGVISLGVYKYADTSFLNRNTSLSYATLTPAIEKGKQMNEHQFNEALSILSNTDISTYLEKNGSEDDIALITPDLKENALPNKDDYFLNIKTLDNYLDSIDLKN